MSDPRPAAADPSAMECLACVYAHGMAIRYRRLGAGRSVLVLHEAAHRDPAWGALTNALAARFRLLLPEALPADAATCLSAFLEGLGAAGVGVVAGDGFHGIALELACLDPDRVARVVLVTHAARAADRDDAGAMVDVMVLPLERAAERALPWVARYLDGGAGSRTG